VQPLPTSSGSKSKRFIPIAPALPNGLKDVLQASRISSSKPADSRQLVHSLLNPCNCRSLWTCTCRASSGSSFSLSSQSGLTALAQAAELHTSELPSGNSGAETEHKSKSSLSPAPRSRSPLHKRPKYSHADPPYAPDLAPILSSFAPSSTSLPIFPFMPPISTINLLAGSGCTCGVECSCPGCEEHRGSEHASKDHRSCADGCGTCIDNNAGIALPGLDVISSTNSMINQFFRRAAALPAPPSNRRMGLGTQLDPMDVTTYATATRNPGDGTFVFGFVNLPKLECCGGNCNCTDGGCRCGNSCDGRCAEHLKDTNNAVEGTVSKSGVVTPDPVAAPPALRGCCANKIRTQ